ncbi:TIGR04376 family protein [Geitlerinema sp. PCC 9228]|uniref:TIGR04376 family protein n=1 Tax=Geitlerinema sp. PCC 9228 TaxID=111611 RepID=UPI0008F9A342|nr:TIGR04376 family protein [Geitlerinema sp. PCC 9228]
MGLFEDVSKFLEERLDEFLRKHPHLELQALEEQLREQEDDTLKLILDLQKQEKQKQNEILSTAQDIQRWHQRMERAEASGRQDLAQAAREREATLLRKGNQLWGQMQGINQRIEKAKELYYQLQNRRKEVSAKAKAAAAEAKSKENQESWDNKAWFSDYEPTSRGDRSNFDDPLEQQFQRWETEQELEEIKRNVNK